MDRRTKFQIGKRGWDYCFGSLEHALGFTVLCAGKIRKELDITSELVC